MLLASEVAGAIVHSRWHGSGTPTEWAVFTAIVGAMLLVDLVIANRQEKEVTAVSALVQTGFWVALALGFAGYVWRMHSAEHGLLFLTGYVIEEALSVDNLFVFLVVFGYFKVRPSHQRRILFWGIMGAVVLRASLIFVGAAVVREFHFVLYGFGLFLLYTSWKLLFSGGDDEVEPEKNRVLVLMRKYIPISPSLDGGHFVTRANGKWMATPLLAVLVVVETTDLVFALDSVPAIFSITQDPFLIYTSNIFAILGLRALYFALAAMMGKFRFLNVGLALVLAFVGAKMLGEHWVAVPIPISLGIVATLILGAILASLLFPEKEAAAAALPPSVETTPLHDGETQPAKPAK